MDEKNETGPVSGEILGGRTPQNEAAPRENAAQEQVLDAEYETIAAEPARREQGEPRPARSAEASGAGLEVLRPRQGSAKEETSRRAGPVFWTFGAIFVLGAFWVSGGHALLGAAPFLQAAKPAPALRIASLESRVETYGGKPLLIVDGEAVNDGDTVRTLPSLSINVRGRDGRTTHYFLGTNDRRLQPGGHFAFSSRLQAPKHGVEKVSVTIGEPED